MSWAKGFRIRQYLSGSLWIMPLVGGLLGVLLGSLESLINQSVHLPTGLTYSASTASTLLSAIVGATAALTGFVVTVTVLVVQMATGTFSARYMRLWYRDRMLKATLALLVGTLAFAFALLRRVESTHVPNLGTSIAGLLLIACLMLFLIFLDRFLHRLRPVAVAVLVADYVHRDFERHEAALTTTANVFWGEFAGSGESPALVVHSARPGAIQALDFRGLVRWARAHDRLIVIRHAVGDFVPGRAKLMEVYGGGVPGPGDEARLHSMVVLGAERTIEQDPAFAIRIMVDIADKALSPAVNDPTTAVQVLNHLGDVLRLIGMVNLSKSKWSGDRDGRIGVVIPVRRWEDYLSLATTEIRQYGASSIQVMRRMRAMLEELHDEIVPERRLAVDDELARLDATVARAFGDSIDLDRASIADAQGIGGRARTPEQVALTPVDGATDLPDRAED
jgi:uncharacterized membrane protein